MTRAPRDEGGFSTVELLVVVVISAVLGTAVVSSVVRTMQVSAAATVRVDRLTALQTSHERIARNVRAADPITVARADELAFTVHDDTVRRREITYRVTGSTVTAATTAYDSPSGSPSGTTTRDVATDLAQGGTPVFSYLDAAGATWDGVDVADITHVEIALVADIPGASPVPLSTTVFVRNSVIP